MFPRFAILLLASLAPAQTFTARAPFLAAGGTSQVLVEDFNSYANWAPVPSLFGPLITFASPTPTIFITAWGSSCGALGFGGGGLIPEPRFTNASVVIPFSRPVYGVGAQVFDDTDGIPWVSTISLTVLTTTGQMITVAETCNSTGDVGFLGAIAAHGIVRATFSIAGTGGNLEVDNLTVLKLDQAAVHPYGVGCAGSLGVPQLDALTGSVPSVGTNLVMIGLNIPGVAVLALGTSSQQWNGLQLPFDGAVLGAPGCTLLTAPEVLLTGVASGGAVAAVLPIPNNSALIGTVFFAQQIALDAIANALGLTLSNAAVCIVGM